jgi:Ca2+-binding RTX toxin-like protein
MAVLTVTPNFPDRSFDIDMFFRGVGQGWVRYSTSSGIVFGTPDHNLLVLNGERLQYDANQGNPWVGGTVTSIALWNSRFDKKIADITGLHLELSEIGPLIGIPLYGTGGLLNYLFGGQDSIVGSIHDDSLYAEAGNDTVIAGAGDDDIAPGAGDDIVNGGAGYDLVTYWDYLAIGGDDTTPGVVVNLRAATIHDPWGGTDQIVSIEGVEGTYYADTLTGSEYDNLFYGLDGDDLLIGLGGDDFFVGGRGADTIEGGEGFDTISYANYAGIGSIQVDLEAGTVIDADGYIDIISGIEGVRGTGNADTIIGSWGAEEVFEGLGGDDYIVGGLDYSDAVSYASDKAYGGLLGVYVDLDLGTARDGFGGTDTLWDIRKVYGSLFDDTIYGDWADNTLTGNLGADLLDGRDGSDALYGGDGNDRLYGREGEDWLYGGTGNDTLVGGKYESDGFVFNTKLNGRSNVDRILDFEVWDDTIYLARSVFTKLKAGWLSSSAFYTGTKAHDKSDRIIFNKKTGDLFYDPDGTGKAAQVKFAVLSKSLKMAYYDFAVY